MIFPLAVASALCSALPAVLFCVNLSKYVAPDGESAAAVSLLIPARNEEATIAHALDAALASRTVELEVLVMDDASTDRTASIVAALATRDARVRLLQAPPLPAGWNGKQHACWTLAHAARYDILCFVDADVRLQPEALTRMAAFLPGNGLVSGFPRQLTGTWLEWMLLPLIHFVLLGFLPLSRMRAGTDPSLAAGCGQFLMADRAAYFTCGGHAGIKTTMHDGLRLPKLFRAAGFRTDLADLTALATCRMYTTTAQVWNGLAKNAIEGIGHPQRIVPVSLLLFTGQVLPFLLLFTRHNRPVTEALILFAVAAAWLPRFLGIRRFRQDVRGAVLHPVGIVLLLALQWYALGRKLLNSPVTWKSRAYSAE